MTKEGLMDFFLGNIFGVHRSSEVLALLNEAKDLGPLQKIIEALRPEEEEEKADVYLRLILLELKKYPDLSIALSDYLKRLLSTQHFMRAFSEIGISGNDSLIHTLSTLSFNAILPPVPKMNAPEWLIQNLFSDSNDHHWMHAIPLELWNELFLILSFKPLHSLPLDNPIIQQLLNSMQILSLRINALGVSPEIVTKLPSLEHFDSPFMAQFQEVSHLIQELKNPDITPQQVKQTYGQIEVLLEQCQQQIDDIRKKKRVFGVSFKLTNSLTQLNQNLKRLRLLMLLVIPNQPDEKTLTFRSEIQLLLNLVRSYHQKNDWRWHVRSRFDLMAMQVVENTSLTGENYITETPREYWSMFRSSCGGGIIVGFLTLIKLIIAKMLFPLFGTGLLYGLNYAFGFIAIHVAHFKLATKQPAMTASKLASSLEDKRFSSKRSLDTDELAQMIIKIFRSQFIAFLGNIVLSFPVAVIIAYGYFFITGEHAADPEKAQHMIHELNPFLSLAIPHAAITGVYLFLSGLITGYFDNFCSLNDIPKRLNAHPLLQKWLGLPRLEKLSLYIEDNLGQLSGNFFLGIFLGITYPIGIILGLPLDIRHITFSTGNFGLALVGSHFDISIPALFNAILGIAAIGLVNFIVSFGLSLFVAVRSRGIQFTQSAMVMRDIFRYLKKSPLSFILPTHIGGPKPIE
jgi:site-specific recombinase